MRKAIVLFALTAVLACDKEEAKNSAASASASAASTTPPTTSTAAATASSPTTAPATASASAAASAVPQPKCAAGLTGNGFPAYCIKLPTGYTVKEARVTPKRGSIEYDTGTTTDNLTITFDETSIGELAKQVEGEMKFGGDKLDKKGDLPNGNKWFQGSHNEYERIVTLFKGPSGLTLKCSFAYQAKKPPPGAPDVCKSIVVP
jgi:hypothetical protein